jgi:XrtJ-associated TM-motif-TM protein
MKKPAFALSTVLFALMLTSPLYAQDGGVDGCTDSPENPTAILGLVGGVGIAGASLRQRLKAKGAMRLAEKNSADPSSADTPGL